LKWKRLNYLLHRWTAIVLGLLVALWFGSGIVMMYYPYPVLTETEREALLEPFTLSDADSLMGFEAAVRAALDDFGTRGHPVATDPARTIVGARLHLWNGRLAYHVRHQRGYRIKPYLLVDATTGSVLSPIDEIQAAEVASAAVPGTSAGPAEGGTSGGVAGVDLLPRGDHYFFWGSYHLEDFPAYRVRFADRGATFAYVGRETGRVYATADRTARVATWLGTVPHWLYFMWLYEHRGLWTWLNLILPGLACAISLTGIVLGVHQLLPHRRRGAWRVSGYHGLSLWHHVAGVVFGVLVFTWTLSGVFEMLGVGNDPLAGQAEAVRQGPVRYDRIRVGVADAVAAAAAARTAAPSTSTETRESRSASGSASEAGARPTMGDAGRVAAVDLVQLLGRPGYRVLFADGGEAWVDAEQGRVRATMPAEEATRAATLALGASAEPVEAALVDAYDAYYYHRHGREMRLPAWRVRFDDDASSVVYLDAVTGEPTGFVDDDVRTWRWLRDGMHSLDFGVLIGNRPWWDVVVLPLMLGGTLAAVTGLWLALRRLGRIRRRASVLHEE